MSIHQKLIALRKQNGYTQQQIADYLGIDTTSYGRLERGERKISTERLELLAVYYKLPVHELLQKEKNTIVTQQIETNNDDFFEYLKRENQILLNSISAKDKQLEFLIELNKEYKEILASKKK
ncbi:hypothetical protein AEM51_11460 [Bacteroidetes bacterium UKL13-3]|jgi:transcriptional regulator with XRE-family HTH domain|nr:hypothetical protein AEM51_11460 [Bacteroidetes bacterium UKL13-3]HCP94661.1 hypothetical protein [Bacteroidota bacterium]